MTSPRMLFLDRVATLLLAVSFVATGALAIWWWTGDSPLAQRTSAAPVSDLVAMTWFPWASAALGSVLIVMGLRWIAAHVSNNHVSRLALTGSSSEGTLTINASHAANAAADAFADTLGVRSAKGFINKDRGQLVAHIKAVIEPEADLASVSARADEVSSQLAQVIGRHDLRCSVELSVAGRGRSLSRVR